MHKQRGERTDIANTLKFEFRALPCVPGLSGQGMRKRSQAEEIDHHHFAVVVPAIGQKNEFGGPAMRQERGVFGQPAPIDSVKDFVGQKADIGMFLEVPPASENPAQEDRRIDGRNFRIPNSLTGIQVREVIKESAMSGHRFPQKTQSDQDPLPRVRNGNEPTIFADAQCREPKAGCRNAGDHRIAARRRVAAIPYQPGLRACLIPKILEVPLLQFLEKLVIILRKGGRRRRRLWTRTLFLRYLREGKKSRRIERSPQAEAPYLQEEVSS